MVTPTQRGYTQRARNYLTKVFGVNRPKRPGVAMGGGSGGGGVPTSSQALLVETGDPLLTESGQTILIG